MTRISEYFNSTRVNYSTLKQLWDPKWIFIKKNKDDKTHLRVGSYLDCLLSDPESAKNDFIYFKGKRPTGKMLTFVDNLPLSLQFRDKDILFYLDAYKRSNYVNKIEKVISNFLANSNAVSYYLYRVNSVGKVIIDEDEFLTAQKLKKSFLENPYIKKYFNPYEDEINIFYQIPIYFTYKEVECKGLLDGLYIDHRRKELYIFDIKTTGRSISKFPSQVLQFSYYIQASMYETALKNLISSLKLDKKGGAYTTHTELKKCLLKCLDYTVLNFRFVVASTVGNQPATVFIMTEEDLEKSREGGMIYDHYRKGVDELLDDYKWHISTRKWEYSKDYYLKKGIVPLNLFKT